MTPVFNYSPFSTTVDGDRDGEQERLVVIEQRDLARALVGAVFVALPLHFTLEMWERARIMPLWMILLLFPLAYTCNVGFSIFSGYKENLHRQAIAFDALECMGIGWIAAGITLLLVDQLSVQMPLVVSLKLVTLQMVPTSFGACLAKSQLGRGNSHDEKDMSKRYSADFRKLVGSALGALIFAFNIGVTMEPIHIATSIQPVQVIGLIVWSLLISYLMIFMAGFVERDEDEGGIMGPQWAETAVTYVMSLGVSALLLWLFGYLNGEVPLYLGLTWVVVLGYATTLGGSAGRLIL